MGFMPHGTFSITSNMFDTRGKVAWGTKLSKIHKDGELSAELIRMSNFCSADSSHVRQALNACIE